MSIKLGNITYLSNASTGGSGVGNTISTLRNGTAVGTTVSTGDVLTPTFPVGGVGTIPTVEWFVNDVSVSTSSPYTISSAVADDSVVRWSGTDGGGNSVTGPSHTVYHDGIVQNTNVLIGTVSTINASADGTGTYAATGLPRGATIDTTTGIITYNAMLPEPATQVTVTRGGTQVQQFMLTPLYDLNHTGSYVTEAFLAPHVGGIEAGNLWDTVTYAADADAIITAKRAAYADKGSYEAPKYHKVVYTGGDLARYEMIFRYNVEAAEANSEYTFIVIDFQGATFGSWRASYKEANVTLANAVLTGDPTNDQNRSGVIANSNPGHTQLWKCKCGPYFDRVAVDSAKWEDWFDLNAEPMFDKKSLTLSFCHIAGQMRGCFFQTGDAVSLMVGTIVSHMTEDFVRSFGLDNGDHTRHNRIGCIITRVVASGVGQIHTDIDQSGAQAGSGWTIEKYIVGEVAMLAGQQYGYTGGRYQDEGQTGTYDVTMRDILYATSGYDVMSTGNPGFDVKGLVAAPPPGTGSFGPRITAMIAASPLDKAVASQLAAHATDSVAYGNTLSGINTEFQNLSGSVQDRHWIEGQALVNKFVPDEIPVALHPAAIRDAYDTAFLPANGWSFYFEARPNSVFRFEDEWGVAPTGTAGTVTVTAFDSTSLTVTTSAAGWVYYTVDTDATTPTYSDVIQGCTHEGQYTGVSDAYATAGPELSTVAAHGRFWVDAAGSHTYDLTSGFIPDGPNMTPSLFAYFNEVPDGAYRVHAVIETEDGYPGLVSTSSEFTLASSLVDFPAVTFGYTGAGGASITENNGVFTWVQGNSGLQTLYWDISALEPEIATTTPNMRFTFDVSATDVTETLRVLTSLNIYGGAVRYHTQDVTGLVADEVLSFSFDFAATADSTYLLFRVDNAAIGRTITLSNLRIVEI